MWSHIKMIIKLLAPKERKKGVVILVLMLLASILEFLGVGLIVPLIGLMTQANPLEKFPLITRIFPWLLNLKTEMLVVLLLLTLTLVYLVKFLFMTYFYWRQSVFSGQLNQDLSNRLFQVFLRQPYLFHLQNNSVYLVRTIAHDVSMMTMTVIPSILVVASEALVCIVLIGFMFWFGATGAMLTVLFIGVPVFLYFHFAKEKFTRLGKTGQKFLRLSEKHLAQGLGGVKDILVLGRAQDMLDLFSLANEQCRSVRIKLLTIQQSIRPAIEILVVFSLTAVVATLIFQGKDFSHILTIVAVFAASAFRLLPSVNKIFQSMQLIRYGMPCVETVSKNMELKIIDDQKGEKIPPFSQEISLREVSFSYPGSSQGALNNISFKIKSGECIGIIGESGSGKSTLVDILLGLHTQFGGIVEIDGANILQNIRSWQNQIGYVGQNIYLTDDTIRRNVAFGIPEDQIKDEEVWRALEEAQLKDFVSKLSKGINESVGERGSRLSGGQRQRIGIARALYHSPRVLFFDEATSALDVQTEQKVMDAILNLRSNRTIILITHRLSTVVSCDRIFEFKDGNLVFQGCPKNHMQLSVVMQNNEIGGEDVPN